MPSDDAGPAYRLVLAAYAATVATAGVAVALLDAGADVLYPAVVAAWFGTVVAVGVAFTLADVPRAVRPRRLYASGWSWAPSVAPVAAAAALLLAVATRAVPLAPDAGVVLVLSLFGFLLALVGWLVRLLARNAEARARLAATDEVREWRARPAPARRRLYVAGALAYGAAVVALVAWTRSVAYVGILGGAFGLLAGGFNPRHYWLADEALVHGNPQTRFVLDRDRMTDVALVGDHLRIDRRGRRPSLTCDAADLDEPGALADALRAWAGIR